MKLLTDIVTAVAIFAIVAVVYLRTAIERAIPRFLNWLSKVLPPIKF